MRMFKKVDIKQMLAWVYESYSVLNPWKAESWEDYSFRDNVQWKYEDAQKLISKGITPITINRIFPVINLINGYYILNRNDLVAKGRTREDNELSQTMSEAIAYVMDANQGVAKQQKAFEDQIIAGFGCLEVGYNSNPLKESVQIKYHPWHSIYWDAFASPWMDADECRYVFTSAWKNIEDVIAAFPDKRDDIKQVWGTLSDSNYRNSHLYSPTDEIEDFKSDLMYGTWTDKNRVKVIDMWYTVYEKGVFATMPDGRVIDLDCTCGQETVSIIKSALKLESSYVKRMRVSTFIGELLLQDDPTPFPYDEFPFIPYVGYLDRFNLPFGIPRQIKGQNEEVNKRRSTALALVNSRRVIIEEKAVEDEENAYREANRFDAFIVVKEGKLDKVSIQDLSQLSSPQLELLNQSEREIKEIAGANDEALGYNTYASQSGVAVERKQQSAATMTASLMENERRSLRMLGERIMPLIQKSWTAPKTLRVTDRVSGAQKWIEINQTVYDDKAGAIVVKNDITQARFDLVAASKPMTDTLREKNIEFLSSAIKMAPPEAIGPMVNLMLELSDIPDKDKILKQIKAATGMDTSEDDMTEDEKDQLNQQKAMEQAATAAREQAFIDKERELDLQRKEAEIRQMDANAQDAIARAEAAKTTASVKAVEAGSNLANQMLGGE